MGLALVRRGVEAHGGRVWAEPEGPGCGATFWFTLATGGLGGVEAPELQQQRGIQGCEPAGPPPFRVSDP